MADGDVRWFINGRIAEVHDDSGRGRWFIEGKIATLKKARQSSWDKRQGIRTPPIGPRSSAHVTLYWGYETYFDIHAKCWAYNAAKDTGSRSPQWRWWW